MFQNNRTQEIIITEKKHKTNQKFMNRNELNNSHMDLNVKY